MIVIQMFLIGLLLRDDSHVVRLYISYSIDCGGSKVDFLLIGPVNTFLYSWLSYKYYMSGTIRCLYKTGLAASKKSERNEPDKSYQFNGGNTFESLRSRFNSVSDFEGSSSLKLII